MKKKVFGIGKIRKIVYTKDILKGMFENKVAPLIYWHTSEYDEGASPLVLGESKNFEVREDGVYGDIELNQFGSSLKDKNAIKGISVELDLDTRSLSKIALLPTNVAQSIQGAEFQDSIPYMQDFEQEENNGSDDSMDEKAIRLDERMKVEIEMKEKYDKKEIERTLEFSATLTEERTKIEKEIKLGAIKEKCKTIIKEKFPETLRKSLEFALDAALDEESEIIKEITSMEGKQNSLTKTLVKENEFQKKDAKGLDNLTKETLSFLGIGGRL